MQKTISITVSGKVQGVFFRQSTREKATELNIRGEINNLPDETVYIIATGEEEQLNHLKEWCWQGPPRAEVALVTSRELPLREFDKFYILR